MAAKSKQADKDEWRELRNTVYTFFYYSNKPIGGTELSLQFKNQSKKNIDSVLDDLIEKGKIVLRPMGRSKLYYLAQNIEYGIDDPAYTDEVDAAQDQREEKKVLRYLRWRHEQMNAQMQALKRQNESLSAEIGAYNGAMSDLEVEKAIAEYRAVLEENAQFESIQCVDSDEFARRKKELEALRKEALVRQKMCKEMVNSISEGLEIKAAQLREDAGLE
ncbi:26S proteasome regulatory subunit, ATPase 3, interacting protein [Pancytospora philotis]|nr:26S proteasome regulatory subunit, ATPase 3, interacting protein [Pancytospora philotis]